MAKIGPKHLLDNSMLYVNPQRSPELGRRKMVKSLSRQRLPLAHPPLFARYKSPGPDINVWSPSSHWGTMWRYFRSARSQASSRIQTLCDCVPSLMRRPTMFSCSSWAKKMLVQPFPTRCLFNCFSPDNKLPIGLSLTPPKEDNAAEHISVPLRLKVSVPINSSG